MRQILLLAALTLLFVVAIKGQNYRQKCRPNTVFKLACNTCRCSPSGTDMACTRMFCPPNYSNEPQRVIDRKPKMCEPGSYFKMDCNDCRCNLDGTNAACTLKACPPMP